MLTVIQLIALTPQDIRGRALAAMVPTFVTKETKDDQGNKYAKIVAGVFIKAPNGSGKVHKVEIRLYPPLGNNSPCWASCSCEYHMYNVEVALTINNSSSLIYSNGQLPSEKNPTFKPHLCKHALAVAFRALKHPQVKKILMGLKASTSTKPTKKVIPMASKMGKPKVVVPAKAKK